MYCKFKEGDIVMVKRDTTSYYGATVRKWVCVTVIANGVVYDSRCGGYVYVGSMNMEKDKIRGLTLIPIKDLKKISDKKIPKGSYSAPRFNNGDHVLYKGKNRFVDIKGCVIDNRLYYNEYETGIEGWVVDNKPYYNECRIVIRTVSGNHMIVDECDTCKFDDCRFYNIGIDIAFTRLMGKWKLINTKSNLQKFLEGDVYVRVKKNDYCKFMCTLHDHDIWLANPVSFSISASINDTLTFGVFSESVQFIPGSCSYVKNVIDFEELTN